MYLILQRPSAGLLLRLVGLWSSPRESLRGESPPTNPAASALYGVLGMPNGGGRLVLPPPPGPPPGDPRPHHPQRGTVRSTGALGNEEGESGLPPAAAYGAQPTATAKRRAPSRGAYQ